MQRTDVEETDVSAVRGLTPELTVDELKRCWLAEEKLDVARSLVKLYLVKHGPGKPSDAELQAAKSDKRRLSYSGLTLHAAGMTDGCLLLAVLVKGAGACCLEFSGCESCAARLLLAARLPLRAAARKSTDAF